MLLPHPCRRRLMAPVLATMLLAPAAARLHAAARPPATPLDNAAIVSLLRLGFSPAVIAAKIRQAHLVRFDISLPALARMQAAGAPPAIRLAMIERETPHRGRRGARIRRRRSAELAQPLRRLAPPAARPPGPPIVYIWDRSRAGLAARCWSELHKHFPLRLAFSPADADWLLVITAQGRGLRRKETLQVFDNRTQLLLWSGQADVAPFRRSAIRRLADRFWQREGAAMKKGGAAGTQATPPPKRG